MDDSVREFHRTALGTRLRLVGYPRAERHPSHAHAHTSITLLVRGTIGERVGNQEVQAGPLTVLVKSAGVVHQNAIAGGTWTLQVYLDPSEEAALDPLGHLGAWRSEAGGESARVLLRLASLSRAARVPEAIVSDALVELVAAARAHAPGDAPPPWLRRAREALRDPRMSIHDAAAGAGVHPVHLARRFRAVYGESPTAFRSRIRVCRAAGLLAGGRGTLADAAMEAGYADQSHLTRELQRRVGLSPRALRTLSRTLHRSPEPETRRKA